MRMRSMMPSRKASSGTGTEDSCETVLRSVRGSDARAGMEVAATGAAAGAVWCPGPSGTTPAPGVALPVGDLWCGVERERGRQRANLVAHALGDARIRGRHQHLIDQLGDALHLGLAHAARRHGWC